MAQKRMFSPEIVASDAFIEMPVTAQCLYFHLGMRADDDGFVNPQITMRMIGVNSDDLKILLAKRFLLQFQNGVVVVKHWRINNFIRKDRYKETNYIDEKNMLRVKENQSYTLDPSQGQPISLVPWKTESEIRSTIGQPNVIPTVNAGKDRLGKDRLGKVIEDTPRYGEFQKVRLEQKEYDALIRDLGEQPTLTLIAELDQYIASKGRDPYKSHYATIKAWFRRRIQEHAAKTRPRSTSPNVVEI